MIIPWFLNTMQPVISKTSLFLLVTKELWDTVIQPFSNVKNIAQFYDMRKLHCSSSLGYSDLNILKCGEYCSDL